MPGKILITSIIIFSITAVSFFSGKKEVLPEPVKSWYLQQAKQFENEIVQLQQLAATGNEKQLQQQFLKTRLAYKEIEPIVAYYFNFFAVKLNGPGVPFFEEDEPDMGQQQPNGMQLIEAMLFPSFNKTNTVALNEAIARLLLDTRTMQETNESDAFSEAFVFDAITEELFSITALGIAGFDSQVAANGLPECGAALNGLQKITAIFKNNFDTKEYAQLQALFNDALHYIQQHNNFNSFNRMEFIRVYLNPVTAIIARYKMARGLGENKSPMFYSSIKKSNTLFDVGIFDVNKYLDDNTISPEKIALGKRLFFDTQLSVDNKRSCATCHNPAKAFTDGLSTSVAMDGHTALPRNAPTIWNAALQRNLFFDNRSPSLEDQVMQVLNNAKEMHGSARQAAEKIITQKEYVLVYARAFPGAEKTDAAQNICNAIACYERTLVALNSRFDKHMRGQPALNKNEIDGFNLFMGKARCGTCHFMPLFSGAKPPRYYYTETEVIGVPDKNLPAKNKLDEDIGRYAITNLPLHRYAFKTSTLRNIALTAPYMHNGVFKTLEQVLDFYNNGGGKGLKIAPSNQTLPFEKLQLSGSEKANIILFLKTLTDTTGISESPAGSSF
ncbi:cytochrome c peroxidase [Ferruginibacter profundus]